MVLPGAQGGPGGLKVFGVQGVFRSAGPRHVLRPNGLDRLQILGLGWSFLCRLALCCHRLAPISPRSPAGCCKSKTGNWLFYPPALFIAFHCKFPSELASFALSLLAILQDHHLQNQRPQLPQASERKSFVGGCKEQTCSSGTFFFLWVGSLVNYAVLELKVAGAQGAWGSKCLGFQVPGAQGSWGSRRLAAYRGMHETGSDRFFPRASSFLAPVAVSLWFLGRFSLKALAWPGPSCCP